MEDTQRIVKCGNLSLHTPGGFFKVSIEVSSTANVAYVDVNNH